MTRRAVVCAPRPPEHDRESGSRRVWDLIGFLQDGGWSVTLLVENGRGAERTLRELEQRGVMVLDGLTPRATAALAHGRFGLAIVAFYHFAERVIPLLRDVSPSTAIAVDSVDLHLLREARQALRPDAHRDGLPSLSAEYGERVVRELNVYAAADAVVTVSAKEARMIDDFLGRAGHAVVVADCEDLACSPIPFADRRGILFVGNFRHPPNGEATAFLLDRVLPRVPSDLLAEHPVRIVGTGLDRWLRGRRRLPEFVEPVGWAPSLLPYLHASRISVAPLLHGAGTKRKTIQALMAGLPTVTTPVGAEGLGLEAGRDALMAADEATFAGEIERLLTDRALWERVRDAGREAVAQRHARGTVAAQVGMLVERLATGARGEEAGGSTRRHVPAATSRVAGAFVVASPNPAFAWPAPATVQIAWDAGNRRAAEVRVSTDGGPERLLASGRAGRETIAWVMAGRTYDLRLYAGGECLASTTVVGTGDPSLAQDAPSDQAGGRVGPRR